MEAKTSVFSRLSVIFGDNQTGIKGKIRVGVLFGVLDNPSQVTQRDYMEIAKAMKELGFKQSRARIDKVLSRVYVRGTNWEIEKNQINLEFVAGEIKAYIAQPIAKGSNHPKSKNNP